MISSLTDSRVAGSAARAPKALARRAATLGLCLTLWPLTLYAAPPTRAVTGARVELAEVLPDVPEEMRAIDICPAPAAGSSRLLERQVIERQIREAGFDVKGLDIPTAVRLERLGRKYTPAELGALLEEPVKKSLPPGVVLQRVQVSTSLSLEEGASPRPVQLPRLPHRSGAIRLAFAVEFDVTGDVPLRVPVTAILHVAPEAALAAIKRGARVQLTIQRGAAKISAEATALSDGDVGQQLGFRVSSTGKVLRGILLSPTLAKVTQ